MARAISDPIFAWVNDMGLGEGWKVLGKKSSGRIAPNFILSSPSTIISSRRQPQTVSIFSLSMVDHNWDLTSWEQILYYISNREYRMLQGFEDLIIWICKQIKLRDPLESWIEHSILLDFTIICLWQSLQMHGPNCNFCSKACKCMNPITISAPKLSNAWTQLQFLLQNTRGSSIYDLLYRWSHDPFISSISIPPQQSCATDSGRNLFWHWEKHRKSKNWKKISQSESFSRSVCYIRKHPRIDGFIPWLSFLKAMASITICHRFMTIG